MKYAADFRSIARSALSGRWTIAVVAGLVASVLGAVNANGPRFQVNFNDSGANMGLEFAGQQVAIPGIDNEALMGILVASASFVIVLALAMMAVSIFLGSVVGLGYAKFNLDLVDRREQMQTGVLFDYFRHWKTAVAANLLQALYVFLWMLLFIIPGIVAGYSYAMTGYILAEHPELTASEAIDRSKQMMYGNRFRLFCLELSFIGWNLLCILTLGIGNLWLTPYQQAAKAAFYREISGTEHIADPIV